MHEFHPYKPGDPEAPTLARISFGQTWESQVPCTWMTSIRRNKRTLHTLHLVTPSQTIELPHLHKYHPDGPKSPKSPPLGWCSLPHLDEHGIFLHTLSLSIYVARPQMAHEKVSSRRGSTSLEFYTPSG